MEPNLYTIGALIILAKKGCLEATVLPKNESGFKKTYKKLKGSRPIRDYYSVTKSNKSKWGDELRIIISNVSEEELFIIESGLSVDTYRTPDGAGWRFGNKELFWELIELGFDFCRVQQNYNEIISKITKKFSPN